MFARSPTARSRCALRWSAIGRWLPAITFGFLLAGCGTTQSNLATQQLLESDAIDAAIAGVDFTPLKGERVYFDDSYIKDYKGVGFVNSNYVISGLRQQILAAGCYLQEKREEADVVVEGRIGTLGSDQHDVVYGIPKNNALTGVASVVPGSPALPSLPELSVAKKVASHGAAKIALFAYDLESRERVWQSGLSIARSTSRDSWFLGAGPIQSGTIHRNRVRFAGTRFGLLFRKEPDPHLEPNLAAYERSQKFLKAPDNLAPQTLLAEPAAPPAEAAAPELIVADQNAKPLETDDAPVIQQTGAEITSEDEQPDSPQSQTPAGTNAPAAPPDPTPSPGSAPANSESPAESTPASQDPPPFPEGL